MPEPSWLLGFINAPEVFNAKDYFTRANSSAPLCKIKGKSREKESHYA